MLFLLPLPFLSLLLPLTARAEQRFRVIDRLGAGEIEENTQIFIDDNPVGGFQLSAHHQGGAFDATAPDAAFHTYRICGKVVTRDPTGEIAVHDVDTSGTLSDLAGRTFEAMTFDFRLYFLRDVTTGQLPSGVHINQGKGCAPAIS